MKAITIVGAQDHSSLLSSALILFFEARESDSVVSVALFSYF